MGGKAIGVDMGICIGGYPVPGATVDTRGGGGPGGGGGAPATPLWGAVCTGLCDTSAAAPPYPPYVV